MTFGELKDKLSTLDEEQLKCDVTVYLKCQDEFFACKSLATTKNDDVLDVNHPVIIVEDAAGPYDSEYFVNNFEIIS